MIDARVYSRRYVSLMWVRNPIMMAEKAHCYPCCDVPTDWMCRRCLEFRCKLNRNEDKMSVIAGGNSPGDIAHVGMSGESHKEVAQMLAFAEVAAAEMALPYHLLGPGGNCRPLLPLTRRRPEKACQLPGCQNTTRHRGGYCCPEHCREHRAQMGKKVKALGR